jgi:pimeloyl-ACP methyl ester carboxylesterase
VSKVRIFIVSLGLLGSRFSTLRSTVQPAPSHLLRVVLDRYFLVCLRGLRQLLFSSRRLGTVAKSPFLPLLSATGRGFPVAKAREKNTALSWKIIASISSPVLVIRSIGSAVLPYDVAKRMEKGLSNGRLWTITGAGHGVMADNPGGFADAL